MSPNFPLFLLAMVFLTNISAKTVNNITKRELNWNSERKQIEITSNSAGNFRVDYLIPNTNNDRPIETNMDYMAFTLYSKNSNTGEFYFVLTENVVNNPCSTLHAQAYYHFFQKCPNQEKNLIASGWCYQGSNGKGLVFNSDTFNKKAQPYLDSQYYKSNNRETHAFERNALSGCFEEWKSSNFQVSSWKCPVQSVSAGRRRKRATVNICSDCTCDAPLNRFPKLLTLSMVITALLIV